MTDLQNLTEDEIAALIEAHEGALAAPAPVVEVAVDAQSEPVESAD